MKEKVELAGARSLEIERYNGGRIGPASYFAYDVYRSIVVLGIIGR